MFLRRRLLGMLLNTQQNNGLLPAGYIQLSYIESTGTQYINTLINGQDVTRFVIKAESITRGNSNAQVLGGTVNNAMSFFGVRSIGNEKNWYPMDENNNPLVPETTAAIIDATISDGSQTGTITNVTTGVTYGFDRFTSTPATWSFPNEDLLLFGGASDRRTPNGKCYMLKIYTSDGKLARDLIPCLDANGIVCMYDTVSKQTFYNQGENAFIAGKVVIPEEYSALSYIQSSGSQRINTELTGNIRWVLTAQSTSTNTNTQVIVASTSNASAGTWYGSYSGYWGSGSVAKTSISHTIKAISDVTLDSTGAHGTVNGEAFERNVTTAQGDWQMFHTLASDAFIGKLFNAMAYQDGKLVAHMVPAKRKQDEVIGLYDRVRNKFFTNNLSGSFTAGE